MNYETVPDCQIKDLNEIYLKYFGYKTDGIFVEGGAFDGYTVSNTWGLAKAGWRGLYIEPILDNYNRCKLNHKIHPNITTIQTALGNFTGTIDMHLAGGNSSYSPTLITSNLFSGTFDDNRIETVPITTLDEVLKKNNIPTDFDLLVIDTECSEVQVLEGFTLSLWKPKMVITETHEGYQYKELSVNAPFINKFFKRYNKILADKVNNIYMEKSYAV